MTPSYSRVTNMLFWSLLLGSLLAILVFEFGPERRLDILSQASLAARAQDDRSQGGHSVTTLMADGDLLRFRSAMASAPTPAQAPPSAPSN